MNEPRVGRFNGSVLLIGGADYLKHLTPDRARKLADELYVNANSIDKGSHEHSNH